MNLTSGSRRSSLRSARRIGACKAAVRLLPITLAALAWAAPGMVIAATPASGTLTPETEGLKISYMAGPFTASNPAGLATDGPVCNAAAQCDSFRLTITTPQDSIYTRAKVEVTWGNAGSDYDIYVYNGDIGNRNGMIPADVGESAGSTTTETVTFDLTPGTQVYTVKTVPFAVTPGETDVVGTAELVTGTPGGGGGGGEDPGASCTLPTGVSP